MKATDIQKYSKKSIGQLRNLADKKFNAFIRQRDAGKPCISCGKNVNLQAGHFYSAGHHPALRYNEDDCHGQCVRCNLYLSGNLNEYRKGLERRLGPQRVKRLDEIADMNRRRGFKWDRFSLIETILKISNFAK